jgi:hypothetical protein
MAYGLCCYCVQALDDTSMNLQSMAGSKYIGPFMNTVQTWEKYLSHIAEVIDVSRLRTFVKGAMFCVDCVV